MKDNSEPLKKVKIKKATEISEDALGVFFKQMFPDRAGFMRKHWRWLYRVDEFPEVQPPLVAILDGKVIGQVAQIPIIVKRGSLEKLAVWGVDFGILPAYRKYGLGYKISLLWMEQYPIYLAFCTEASFRIVLKQGWEPRFTTYDLRLPLRPDHYTRYQRGLWRIPMQLVGGGWNLLARLHTLARTTGWKKLRQFPLTPRRLEGWSVLHHPKEFTEPLHVLRNSKFFQWRLLKAPFVQQYHILKMEDADVAAILRTFRNGNLKCARVLSISGEAKDIGTLNCFLGSLVSWAVDYGVDLINLVTSDPVVADVARHWLPVKTRLRFAFYSNDPEGQQIMRGTDHIWEFIDSDFDFLS